MPEFAQSGVTAGLLVTELQDTLSENVKLTMGKSQQDQCRRIRQVLATGRRLPESYIPGLSDIQQLGKDGGMALLVVKAGNVADRSSREDAVDPAQHNAGSGTLHVDSYCDPATEYKQNAENTYNGLTASTLHTDPPVLPQSTGMMLPTPRGPQAISLCIGTTARTYRIKDKGNCSVRDLRIEVYLDGELVEVQFVPSRELGKSVTKVPESILLSGTRVHRQVEKPWVYQSKQVQGHPDEALSRWLAVGSRLKNHADMKGHQAGERPMSGAYLVELAALEAPGDVHHWTAHYGVLDVVIVAGHGSKNGPATPYLKRPTPLPDPKFQERFDALTICTTIDPSLISYDTSDLAQSPLSALSAFVNTTPSLSAQLGSLEDSHHPGQSLEDPFGPYLHEAWTINSGQSLRLPVLVDDPLTGHNPIHAADTIACSGAWAIPEQTHGVRAEDATGVVPVHNDSPDLSTSSISSGALLQHVRSSECSPSDSFGPSTPSSADDVFVTSPASAHATYYGYHELQQINSISPYSTLARVFDRFQPLDTSPVNTAHTTKRPGYLNATVPQAIALTSRYDVSHDDMHHTPKKARTKISSRRGSQSDGCEVRKLKTPTKGTPRTPRRKYIDLNSPARPGSQRSAKRWDPFEDTIEEALEQFPVPPWTQDSAMTYAGPGAQRQIGKIRGGEFSEEAFICGVRYIIE